MSSSWTAVLGTSASASTLMTAALGAELHPPKLKVACRLRFLPEDCSSLTPELRSSD